MFCIFLARKNRSEFDLHQLYVASYSDGVDYKRERDHWTNSQSSSFEWACKFKAIRNDFFSVKLKNYRGRYAPSIHYYLWRGLWSRINRKKCMSVMPALTMTFVCETSLKQCARHNINTCMTKTECI